MLRIAKKKGERKSSTAARTHQLHLKRKKAGVPLYLYQSRKCISAVFRESFWIVEKKITIRNGQVEYSQPLDTRYVRTYIERRHYDITGVNKPSGAWYRSVFIQNVDIVATHYTCQKSSVYINCSQDLKLLNYPGCCTFLGVVYLLD